MTGITPDYSSKQVEANLGAERETEGQQTEKQCKMRSDQQKLTEKLSF